jgi:beta-1,4-mannosyltransferase
MQKRVAFFPSIQEMSANPYWLILESALEKAGATCLRDTPSSFGIRWLMNHRRQVDTLHIHFIRQFYGTSTPGRIRLIYVLWFGIKLFLARLLGFRLVFTMHDLEPASAVHPAWADRLAHTFIVHLSHRIIVHCREASRLLEQKYGRSHNTFLVNHPNFIGWYKNTITKESARIKLNLPIDGVVFMFLGGIRPNKGIETLIQAFRELKGDKFRLIIAGKANRPESYAESLKQMANGDGRISLCLQHITDDDIQIFMNAADISVLPFSKILTSSSTMLAMSFGLPVIIPAIGCLPELIGFDAGWLFEPDNSASLTEVMRSAVLGDYHQRGRCAFERASSFGPELFAKQTISAYWD